MFCASALANSLSVSNSQNQSTVSSCCFTNRMKSAVCMRSAHNAITSPGSRVIFVSFPISVVILSSEPQRDYFYSDDWFIECSCFVYMKLFSVSVLAFKKILVTLETQQILAWSADGVFNVTCIGKHTNYIDFSKKHTVLQFSLNFRTTFS